MARPKSYHGSAEELREIRKQRNEEIRAWGKQVLAEADSVLLGVPTELLDVSDWDQINDLEKDIDTETTQKANPATAKSRTKPAPKAE